MDCPRGGQHLHDNTVLYMRAFMALKCGYNYTLLHTQALHYRKYSTPSDVWSFGVVMYEIWSLGRKPFEGYTNEVVGALVAKNSIFDITNITLYRSKFLLVGYDTN